MELLSMAVRRAQASSTSWIPPATKPCCTPSRGGPMGASHFPMSPEVARRVIGLFREIRVPEHADYGLTPHETRLLTLLVEGHNFKTVAGETGVSPSTVEWH